MQPVVSLAQDFPGRRARYKEAFLVISHNNVWFALAVMRIIGKSANPLVVIQSFCAALVLNKLFNLTGW